jgi:hypothetical protein
MCARQPQRPTPAEIDASYPLREATRHPRPQGVLRCALGRLLAVARRLERLMVHLPSDRELPWGVSRGGARPTGGAGATGASVEPHTNHGIARRLMARSPVDTGLASGATRLRGLPIADHGLEVVACPFPPLPTGGPERWPNAIDLMLALGGDQEVRVDLAAVEHVGAWEEIPSGEVVLDGRPHDAILRGRGRRHHVRDHIRLPRITGFGEGERIAHPMGLALTTVAGLQVVGRGEAHGCRRLLIAGAPAHRFEPRDRTAIIRLAPTLSLRLQGRECPQPECWVRGPHPCEELVALGPDLAGERLACTGVLRQARLGGSEAVPCRPGWWYLVLHPGGRHTAQLVQRPMYGFQDTFSTVPPADRCPDRGGIGPWRASCLDPPPRVTGGQEGREEPLAGLLGEQATATIGQQRAVNAGVRQGTAEGILPIPAAAPGSGGLAVGQPCTIWHHQHQGHAPRGDVHGTPGGRIQISHALIVVDRAKLSAQRHGAVPFGDRGLYRGHRGLWDGRYRVWPPGHGASPRMERHQRQSHR